MNDQYFFADVDLPFHVWVRERTADGHRWVLRATPQASGAAAGEGPDAERMGPQGVSDDAGRRAA